MLENLILWLIIGAAAIYAGRNIYRILSGKTKGCSCEAGCEIPPPQQTIPDLKGQPDKKDQGSA
jgi:hypothetical protein